MINLTIDGKVIEAAEGTTILDAARNAGINIPTLCYLKDINEIGACRVCVVEIEGQERLAASCNTYVEEGMVVHTNSRRVRKARRVNVELILSRHHSHCTTCVRSGNCSLQSLANDLNLYDLPYEQKLEELNWDVNFPLIRDESRCIKCMRCINVCGKVQGIGVWELNGTGARTKITVKDGKDIKDSNCTLCGQCITHCPVGALRARDDTAKVMGAIYDPEKITVVQMAPAVKTSWGDDLNIPKDEASIGRLVNYLHGIGVDYVFTTDFTADLTIMEEGTEFVRGIDGEKTLFTSCCPGWVRFVLKEYPEMLPYLSSAKSPQQMFGSVAKSYFAEKLGVSPDKIFCISVMPCVAKKYECAVPELNSTDAERDVDAVLTTRELSRMLRACSVDTSDKTEENFDSILGMGTGAGAIFGATGGVMEAALRSAHFLITGKNPEPDAFYEVRGMDGWKEAYIDIDGRIIRVAVASGLGNARKLVEAIINGSIKYDFVEIMACPGGCAGGGGQPIKDGSEMAEERGKGLYGIDSHSVYRFSHENPAVKKLYNDFLGEPLSETAHKYLHTDQNKWTLDQYCN